MGVKEVEVVGTEVGGPGSAFDSELVLLTTGTKPAETVVAFLGLIGRFLSMGVVPIGRGSVPSTWTGIGLGRTFIPS